MSSWLSSIADFYLDQSVDTLKEVSISYNVKKEVNPKLEQTNNKIKIEIKNFLEKSNFINQKRNSNLFSSVKILKSFKENQKQIFFGSSLKNSKQNFKNLNKKSPLILFSKIQKTNKTNKKTTSYKIILTTQKINSNTFHILQKKQDLPYLGKKNTFQKIKKSHNLNPHEEISTRKDYFNNKNFFLNKNQNYQEKHHSQDQKNQQDNEENNENTTVNLSQLVSQHFSLLSSLSSLFLSQCSLHKPNKIKATYYRDYKEKAKNPPKIPLPSIGIFALYYILTKQGIISDQIAYSTYKQEIEITNFEITQSYKKRLQIIQDNINKEQSMSRWGILSKLISWLMSFIATITACILIFSGVATIMGAVILASGLFSLTNTILEVTNGWNKIGELLPIKNANIKRKAIGIIKISVGVISLILSIITIIWGGFSYALRALQSITQAISGILTTGLGICIISESISAHDLYYGIANLKDTERNLEKLYFKRKDLMEKADWDLNHIEKLFEDLSFALDLHKETASIDNSFYY